MKTKKNQKKECKLFAHWKILLIVLGAVVVLAIILGMVFSHNRYSKDKIELTQEQTDSVQAVVADHLLENGDDIANYQVKIGKETRKYKELSKVQVYVYSDSITHTYLVDLESNEILMHSVVEYFGSMIKDTESKCPFADKDDGCEHNKFFEKGSCWD